MDKKFKIIAGLIVAIAVILVVAIGTGIIGGGSSDASASDDNTFIVGFDAEFPPYGFKADNGSYVGFDLDLAQEVCDRNGWKLVKQPIDWDAKDSELDSGSIDCIWNGFTMDGRENDYTWSKPYIDNKQVVIVAGDSGIKDISGLAGKTVEVQKDSAAETALNEDNKTIADTFTSLTSVADYNTAFMDLESGACDAVVMDIGVAKYHVGKSTGNFIILDQDITSEKYGVGFKLGNDALKDKVQSTLDEMSKDGTIKKIASNYEDYGVPGSLCI
ncbi:MAG: amino acid ABC transporter substrate-binding protein [archaeon]|nr:amino acid ABC transporter substrate-binding protein [archaeon]